MAQRSSLTYQEFVPGTESTGRSATVVVRQRADKVRSANRPTRYICACDGVVDAGCHELAGLWNAQSNHRSAMDGDSRREVL